MTAQEYEQHVYDRLKRHLTESKLPFQKKCAQVFHKRPYYSDARKGDIITDVSIEIYLSEQDKINQKYSSLWIYECKHYKNSVDVSEVEEFLSKINQIGEASTKGIMVTTKNYKSGAVNFAKSKGIGLYRIVPKKKAENILHFSTFDNSSPRIGLSEIKSAMLNENYETDVFEIVWSHDTKVGYGSLENFITHLLASETD